jgi:hypothetical protein
MGVIGARPGDIAGCLAGDDEACQRVYFGYYLFPRLQRLLEQLKLIQTPLPPFPGPGPDPPPYLIHELAPVILRRVFGDPDPQPNVPPGVVLKTTARFREGLAALIQELDKDIERLQKKDKLGPI